MRREVTLEEISDGKLYDSNDMVKVGCDGCSGCSACCRGMGKSIVLDPCDIFRLEMGLGLSFEALLADKLELNLADGLILPNLRQEGPEEACAFLNEEGRCRIHPYRPGICRLFPLGRVYEEHGFRYFNQIHECRKENRTKVKIRKWLDTPELARYEQFIADWHAFLAEAEETAGRSEDGETRKRIVMCVLNRFYGAPYETGRDFYEQFYERLAAARLEIAG